MPSVMKKEGLFEYWIAGIYKGGEVLDGFITLKSQTRQRSLPQALLPSAVKQQSVE